MASGEAPRPAFDLLEAGFGELGRIALAFMPARVSRKTPARRCAPNVAIVAGPVGLAGQAAPLAAIFIALFLE